MYDVGIWGTWPEGFLFSCSSCCAIPAPNLHMSKQPLPSFSCKCGIPPQGRLPVHAGSGFVFFCAFFVSFLLFFVLLFFCFLFFSSVFTRNPPGGLDFSKSKNGGKKDPKKKQKKHTKNTILQPAAGASQDPGNPGSRPRDSNCYFELDTFALQGK